jgi:hypothetical protein
MQPAAQNPLARCSGFLIVGLPWKYVALPSAVEHQLLFAYPLNPVPLIAPACKWENNKWEQLNDQ